MPNDGKLYAVTKENADGLDELGKKHCIMQLQSKCKNKGHSV